ncbi:hypothetical protein AX14_009419 [Amanita brunnescens Koide BX004]|nr:hypothetical protein AX14_011475 [Amanita brunnescens Koide BX004]KAF8723190.1 hypothetical protein AX14_009419 [Amanita brunnescens Koide BX004]
MGSFFSKDSFDLTKDLLDLRGKVVVVTGANRGIGYSTVLHFARAGAKVYLAARDEKAASDALEKLNSEDLAPGKGEVKWLKLDLSDPREAKKSAEELLKLESRLDILVNNAGVIPKQFELSSDGVSVGVIVNYLSPLVFTRALLPLMIETTKLPGTDVRIVNLNSNSHRIFVGEGLSFKTIEDLNLSFKDKYFDFFYQYGHAKILCALWTKSLQKQFDEANPPVPITVIAVHPGTVKTFVHNKRLPLIIRLYGRLVGVGTEYGAYNSMFAAASKRVAQEREKYKGTYIEEQPIGTIVASPPEVNQQNADDLWNTTEAFLHKIGI